MGTEEDPMGFWPKDGAIQGEEGGGAKVGSTEITTESTRSNVVVEKKKDGVAAATIEKEMGKEHEKEEPRKRDERRKRRSRGEEGEEDLSSALAQELGLVVLSEKKEKEMEKDKEREKEKEEERQKEEKTE